MNILILESPIFNFKKERNSGEDKEEHCHYLLLDIQEIIIQMMRKLRQ